VSIQRFKVEHFVEYRNVLTVLRELQVTQNTEGQIKIQGISKKPNLNLRMRYSTLSVQCLLFYFLQ